MTGVPRPAAVVLVVGTGTDVGKTWVTARVAATLLAHGRGVAVRKPAQSYEAGTAAAVTDAGVLGAATGEDPTTVCPAHRWYEVPMAPPMAAAVLGRPVPTSDDLTGELRWPDGCAVGFVEGAGGVRSPLASDGDIVDLGRLIGPDVVVLVADASLGVLNVVRLSVDVLTAELAAPVVVHLNRYVDHDPLHAANREWLTGRWGLEVTTTTDALAALLAAEVAVP